MFIIKIMFILLIISAKQRPHASDAPRAGAPAAQASPRPCNSALNE